MAIDYKKCAEEIIEKAGGADNINTVSHCMTRLRFTVKKLDKADMNGIKAVSYTHLWEKLKYQLTPYMVYRQYVQQETFQLHIKRHIL